MAKKAAQSSLKARKLDHQRVPKKWSSHKSHRGAITLRGQQELIRLVTDVSMTRHRHTFHYIYEVADDASPDFQMVDYAYSEIMLGASTSIVSASMMRLGILESWRPTKSKGTVRSDATLPSAVGRETPLTRRPPLLRAKQEIEPRFVNGDRVLKEHKSGKEHKNGLVRSMVATSDGTFVYKVLWDGYDVPNYVMQEALEPST